MVEKIQPVARDTQDKMATVTTQVHAVGKRSAEVSSARRLATLARSLDELLERLDRSSGAFSR